MDLGSSRTRIHLRGAGAVCDEPTVVAVLVHRDGRRRVLSVGDEALPMDGRTPDDILAIHPVRDGCIADFEVAEALLIELVRRHRSASPFVKPRMAVVLPANATDMAMRALRDSCIAAGAREVHLVPRPLAAAMGADLPVKDPNGHMVVDLGGSSTEISVISLAGVVRSTLLPGGGEGIDRRIVDHLRKHHALEIGRPTAEHLKCTLGSAQLGGIAGTRVAKGRCLRLGLPRAVDVDAAGIQNAIAPTIHELSAAITRMIEGVPPELASDVVDNGIILVGAGAQLDGLAPALRQLTGLSVLVAEDPGHAAARGAAMVLDETELLDRIAS